MNRTDAVIIGGGQAGLAMSRSLMDLGIDHVVLERGRIAERWRSERWDSLRLLTPNWQSRLPGYRYKGPDPDGFMKMPEVVDYFQRYAQSFDAPVQTETKVTCVRRDDTGFRIDTNRGSWKAPNVVIATGQCDVPFVPDMARGLPEDVLQMVPSRYRNPEQIPEGGVLVVGASASGVQIANELALAGRDVTLSVGRHIRMPRRYLNMDIMWWLDSLGITDETAKDVYSIDASRRQPSFQLVGGSETLDLAVLQQSGVRLVGKTEGVQGAKVSFAADLAFSVESADRKLAGLLARIDAFVGERHGERLRPVTPGPAPTEIDLHADGIKTVLWATGFSRRYAWLRIPVLDERGELRHEGGVTPEPGLYVLGLFFLRRRNSSFIDGVGADALELSKHIASRLNGGRYAVA